MNNQSTTEQEYEEDILPGNPWIYPGHEDDDADIEVRRLESILSHEEEDIEKKIEKKKNICFDIIELIDEHAHELGDGKYKDMMELLKNDLYDKLSVKATIIVRMDGQDYIF